MARTTKRRTKHRGNAAGMVESRGATSARAKQNGNGSRGPKGRPADPRLRVPTWKGAFTRAALAAAVFALVMLLLMDAKPGGVALTAVMLLGIYTPFGYYFDLFLYRRRLAKLGLPTAPTAKQQRDAAPRPRKRKR